MKRKIVWLVVSCLMMVVLIISGCSPTEPVTPKIEGYNKPLSTMSDHELRQMVDRNQEKMENDYSSPRIAAYGIRSIVYQNELILRELQR